MSKIKSIENFKESEVLLNSHFILGGRPENTEGGSKPSAICSTSDLCWSADYYDSSNGQTTYYDYQDCDGSGTPSDGTGSAGGSGSGSTGGGSGSAAGGSGSAGG